MIIFDPINFLLMQLSSKKALIITYYWPPSGGAGVFRWLKFVKYFRAYGWEPIIYTPENPEAPAEDESLLKDIPVGLEVVKTRIWEPYNIYKFITGKRNQRIGVSFVSQGKKKGFLHGFMVWLRGNLLIPDPRVFWVRPSVRRLEDYIKQNNIEAIITTGPPHSMHLIGLKLKKRLNIKWIADFRDPWTNIDFYKELKLTFIADRIHHRLEKKVIGSADAILVVSEQMKQEYLSLNPKRIDVITNGYDEDEVSAGDVNLDSKFSIAHVGTLNAPRNPNILWKALSELITEIPSLKDDLLIRLVGQVDFSVRESLKELSLDQFFEHIEFLKHDEAIVLQKQSQVLLLVVNNTPNASGILTGKFFEYLGSGRVIFGVGPSHGNLCDILTKTGVGEMVDYGDLKKAKQIIANYYYSYKSNNLYPKIGNIEEYSRRSLTGKIIEIIEQV